MRLTALRLTGSLLGVATLLACTLEPSGVNTASMPDLTDGAAFFAANCTSCHGASGTGDGPLAAGLEGVPSDLTQLSASNGGTFAARRALAYIYGDPLQGHLARVMPEFGDAMAQDLVPVEIDGILTPTPRALAGLLAYLESIQQP